MPFTCPHCPKWNADFSSPTLAGLEAHLDQWHPHPKRGSLTVTFTTEELDHLCALLAEHNRHKLPATTAPAFTALAKLRTANTPAC